jgi:hypothetical protein
MAPPILGAATTRAPWQWQLQGSVICYLDAGSWESYRPDASKFSPSVRGRRYEGFPDERRFDICRFHSFAAPLERRFDLCAQPWLPCPG